MKLHTGMLLKFNAFKYQISRVRRNRLLVSHKARLSHTPSTVAASRTGVSALSCA